MALDTLIQYLQDQQGIFWEVKVWKVARVAVYKCSIGNLFEHFEGFSEHGIFHGIFHGIAVLQENNPLNTKDKKGLLIIEWE